MKKRYIAYTAFVLIIIAGFLFWKLTPGVTKENTKLRGIMSDRLGYVSKTNTNVDKYISEIEYRLEENPESSSLHNMLGSAYLQKARETGDPTFYSKAEDHLEKAIELDGKNYEALYQMGSLCLARHHFAEALEYGKKAEAINPYNGPVKGVIFDALIELGRYEEALKKAQEMVDTRPDIASYSRVSYYRELTGNIKGAIEAMQMAVNAGAPESENTAWCKVQLGNLYLNSGDIAEAENQYQLALLEYPFYYHALSALGKLYFIKGDTKNSIEFYRKSLEVSPTAEAMIALGDIYRLEGENDKSEEQYKNVWFMNTILKENGVEADMELALFEADHIAAGDLKNVLKNAEETMIKLPTVKSANTLAWIHYKTGNYAEAEKNILLALRLGTKEPLLYYHAAKIFEKTGQTGKAKEYLEYALKINPRLGELYN
jgi:tetratricopeptide (TPR) repeat protein